MKTLLTDQEGGACGKQEIAMKSDGRLNSKLIIGLFTAILFDTLLQISWKTLVLATPSDPSPLATIALVLTNPAIVGLIGMMALQFFNWLMVLGEADLSYAKPVASLSYACVPIVSVLRLNEAVDGLEIAGVLFVVAGVWFISQTTPMTEEPSTLP